MKTSILMAALVFSVAALPGAEARTSAGKAFGQNNHRLCHEAKMAGKPMPSFCRPGAQK